MRMVVVVVVATLLPACIISKDECNEYGSTSSDEIASIQPGVEVMTSLKGCSTCGHAQAIGTWTPPSFEMMVTGSVQVALVPICPVQDTELDVAPSAGTATADNNHKNCGAVIDYDGYVKNNSNVTIAMMKVELKCSKLGE